MTTVLGEPVTSIRSKVEAFFGMPLPGHIKHDFKEHVLLAELDQHDIMGVIGLAPPFLMIQKFVVISSDPSDIFQSRSVGMGIITPHDTKGHYNELISLALCGQLMASTAAIHLVFLFPRSAPQALQVDGIKPVSLSVGGGKLLRPAVKGTPFFAEATIVKKKMRLVSMAAKISFGSIPYGVLNELKFILMPATALRTATEVPT